MIRAIGMIMSLTALAACGDGRGSAYSSERAQRSPVAYIPVTPGAIPASSGRTLTGPIAVTPGAVPLDQRDTAITTTTLTPVAAPEPVVRFATGPIYSACLGAGRKGATQQRCGCVQWVADRQLTRAQQRRGAGYFNAQHELQEVRQSDKRTDDEFWDAWRQFGQAAGDTCRTS